MVKLVYKRFKKKLSFETIIVSRSIFDCCKDLKISIQQQSNNDCM